ncbi:hypothetical protein ALC57_13442, partial [Trachymyrmex cornetzi]
HKHVKQVFVLSMRPDLSCLTLNWNMVTKNASRPMFYIGDINTVQSSVIPSIYRSSKRVSLG